ncbi:hypothetical protein GW756_00825 [bacterium]|nr:hypothetical protein [bacterium]NCQ54901.1 hypothetical protein [Candidatus Parcubacteria bacterium]NCS66945.1 hypothetical protein [Candidatus Peregrinibacteria bacterium]NCS95892.1 hypothetical protein [bacterium]
MSVETKLAELEYTREEQLKSAEGIALEIMIETDEASAVSRALVLQVLDDFKGEFKPNYEQVRAALKKQDISVSEVEAVISDAVSEICSPELAMGAAKKVLAIVNEAASRGAESALVAFKTNIQAIKKAIKSVKPSGKMLDAELVYNQMAVIFPSLTNNTEAKVFFMATFKD